MKLTVQYGGGVIALPETLLSYLDKADPLTLKLMIHLAADRSLQEAFDKSLFAKSFAVTEAAVENALAFWQNAGLLTVSEESLTAKSRPRTVSVSEKVSENGEKVTVVSVDIMPNYTGRELEGLFERNPAWHGLVDECQKIAEKLFGIHEINRVIGMVDVLRLPEEAILLLFVYAKGLGKCSVNYVAKIAASLANDGITSTEEIEAYIAAKEKVHTLENLIRRLTGIGGRAFTAKENRFISVWSDMALSEELLTFAYEVTVNNIGNFTFQYMNKVLINWQEAGYKTREDAEAAITAYRNGKKESGDTSFDVDDFFHAALNRTKNLTTDPKSS